jgi:hypothetical protein
LRDEKAAVSRTQEEQIQSLRGEAQELRLRLGVLIQLLVAKNVLTAQEIASMIAALEPEDGK